MLGKVEEKSRRDDQQQSGWTQFIVVISAPLGDLKDLLRDRSPWRKIYLCAH